MLQAVKRWVPITYDAFSDYRIGGTNLSAKGLDVIRRRLRGEDVSRRVVGMSLTEWNELETILQNEPANTDLDMGD